ASNVGGGFGGKGFIWAGTLLCAMAARVAERPVRLALSREAVYRTVGGRAPTVQRVALGAERDGTLTALVHTGISQVGRVGGRPEPVGSQSRHLYAARNILIRHSSATLDALPNSAMRAPGEAVGSFALESAMDELAGELGIDPVELRMRNEPQRDPVSGKPFTHRNLRTAYARGAQRFGWADRPPRPRSMRDGRRLLGWGVATAFHMPIQFTADATVRLGVDGTVLVRCAFQEIGVGAGTVQSQIAADALGVPVEAVTVEHGDSALPTGPMAGGSGQTATVAASVLRACEELKRSALALAQRAPGSPLRGRRLDELAARDGGLFAADGSGETYAQTLARAGRPSLEGRGEQSGGAGGEQGAAPRRRGRRPAPPRARGARRPLLRGRGRRGHRRGARDALGRGVRRGAGDQPEDRDQPAARRDRDGDRGGAGGGDARRPGQRPDRERDHGRLPRAGAGRRTADRRLLPRRAGPDHPARPARGGGGRHHRRRGGDRERRAPRDGG